MVSLGMCNVHTKGNVGNAISNLGNEFLQTPWSVSDIAPQDEAAKGPDVEKQRTDWPNPMNVDRGFDNVMVVTL
jgi:hypothetical protein